MIWSFFSKKKKPQSITSGGQDDLPELAFMASLPDITQAKAERAFKSGDLLAFYVRNVKSIGETAGLSSIFEYPNVFAVINTKTGRPIFMVTYEIGKMMGTSALCAFTPEGHSNYGRDERFLDPDAFVQCAKEIAEQRFRLTFFEMRA